MQTTQQQQQLQIRQEWRVGPLPDPKEMEAFARVLPDLPDRITKMAEGHAANRWANDRAQRRLVLLTQIFAFILAMTIIVGGFYLVSIDRPVAGLVAVFGTIAGIIWAMRSNK